MCASTTSMMSTPRVHWRPGIRSCLRPGAGQDPFSRGLASQRTNEKGHAALQPPLAVPVACLYPPRAAGVSMGQLRASRRQKSNRAARLAAAQDWPPAYYSNRAQSRPLSGHDSSLLRSILVFLFFSPFFLPLSLSLSLSSFFSRHWLLVLQQSRTMNLDRCHCGRSS